MFLPDLTPLNLAFGFPKLTITDWLHLQENKTMPTTIEMVEGATGTDKLLVLAASIDLVRHEQAAMSERMHELASRSGSGACELEIETLDLSDLAMQYDTSVGTLRKQIAAATGSDAAIKVGKKWVIRKTVFLDFLKTLEGRTKTV